MNKEKLLEVVNLPLRWNNLELDSDELDEVIEIYDHYLDLLLETVNEKRNSYHDRYAFINGHLEWDINYKNIFINLAIFKKCNLLPCLDYLRLINTIKGPIYNIVNTLLSFTQSILSYYHGYQNNMDTINNRINYFYNNNENIITVWLDSFLLESICESSFISNEYKEAIKLYQKLSDMLRQMGSMEQYKISFSRVINISYYYFMANNYFNTECDEVNKFLEGLLNNPTTILDQINMAGITYRDDFLNYFDYIYKNSKSNKIKVIK